MDKRAKIRAAILDTSRTSLSDDEVRGVVAARGVPVKTNVRAGEPYAKITFVKAIPHPKTL